MSTAVPDSPSAIAMRVRATLAPSIRRGGLPGLLLHLVELHDANEAAVLGIVTQTEGSTYQKQGALVLLDRNGMRHGALSGGCLEPQVEEAARRTLQLQHATMIEFDTRTDDDLIYGSGTGCRGKTQLLLLPQPPGATLVQALAQLLQSPSSLRLDIVTQGESIGAGVATLDDRRWSWRSDGLGELTDLPAIDRRHQLSIESPPRIVLLGAGPETIPFVAFAARLGWQLRVVEHRGRWLQFAHAAGVTEILELAPDDAHALWTTEHPDAVLVMTHNYALDCSHLRHCAASEVGYVGLLGPLQRRAALLRELGEEVVARLTNRLHSPVGLDLGGSGPEALALAIAAELQRYLADRSRVR